MSPFSQSPTHTDPVDFFDPPRKRNALPHSSNKMHSVASPSSAKLTRTVAIIKTSALNRRLDVEHRLLESDFEIVKERQMVFDIEADPDTFFELFDDDAQFLGHGPVWVYVLERRRAVQVLLALMPSFNDAIIGAKNEEQADIQIASLFASSPPFPLSDLPPPDEDLCSQDEYDPGSVCSVDSAVLEALRLGLSAPSNMLALSPGSSDARLSSNGSSNGKQPFRARPLPKTHLVPDISPRTTKAALLRQGLTVDGVTKTDKPRSRMSLADTGRIPPPRREKENEVEKEMEKERIKRTFAGVPGHKRAETLSVASTAPPVIAPRLTKAAALRLGLAQPTLPPGRRRASTSSLSNGKATVSNTNSPAVSPQKFNPINDVEGEGEDTETERGRKNIFDGVPGHKRRASISVTSTSTSPSIVPRTNRSAALRKQGGPPPSSFMFRTPSAPKVPGAAGAHSRSNSSLSAYHDTTGTHTGSWSRPSSTVPSRASSRASYVPPKTNSNNNSSYSSQASESSAVSTASTASNTSADQLNGTASPQRKVRRPSSLQVPTISPRANKSAMLRAQKLAFDAAKPKSPWANASKR